MQVLKGKYTNADIYASIIQSAAYNQIRNICNLEIMQGSHIAIMPDCHAGEGCTVGTTITIKDKAIPNMVGCDIGCGMYVAKLSEKYVDLHKLDEAIREVVPLGFDSRGNIHRYIKNTRLNELACIKAINATKAELGLGTLGGGNHFIELDKGADGCLYLVIHSGSRHLGIQVAAHYQRVAYNKLSKLDLRDATNELASRYKLAGRAKELSSVIPKFQKEFRDHIINEEYAYVQGQDFIDYIHDMKITQEYAIWNRKAMMTDILNKMGLHVDYEFTTIHNYIDTDRMIIRKGAVSANAGERLIIPINNEQGALLCIGKGNPDWNYSAPHGSGRLCSRSKAKAEFTVKEYKERLERAGVYSTSVCSATLDECPMAYKPMETIINDIADTVTVAEIIKPIYNLKASDDDETKAEKFARLKEEKKKAAKKCS